jgi:single-stranded DNA-binding protein
VSLGIIAVDTLPADPQARTAANGKPFATANLHVATEGGESVSVSVIAFSAASAEMLLAHKRGDIVCVTGPASLSRWSDREGVERHGLKMVASRVLSPHQAARQREKISRAEAGKSQDAPAMAPSSASADGELRDDMPF